MKNLLRRLRGVAQRIAESKSLKTLTDDDSNSALQIELEDIIKDLRAEAKSRSMRADHRRELLRDIRALEQRARAGLRR